jgi:hypothetical protein
MKTIAVPAFYKKRVQALAGVFFNDQITRGSKLYVFIDLHSLNQIKDFRVHIPDHNKGRIIKKTVPPYRQLLLYRSDLARKDFIIFLAWCFDV